MNARSSSALLLAVTMAACGGGGSSPGGVSAPNASAPGAGAGQVTPTPAPSPNSTPVDPPAAASCPIGAGTLQSQCGRRNPALQEQVEAAIDRLVALRPELFQLDDSPSGGVYRVRDAAGYYEGLESEMTRVGFCANYDGFELQVKNTNDFSEQYDLLTSDSFIRRGSGAYRSTCTPASFPVDPVEFIAYVRVAFYGFRCQDGVAVPRNGAGELPMGCLGFVTATPKKSDGSDVDSRIHGPEITWTHRAGHEQIEVNADDATFSDFNKILAPLRPGPFVLCASVRGVEGCLNGEVLP